MSLLLGFQRFLLLEESGRRKTVELVMEAKQISTFVCWSLGTLLRWRPKATAPSSGFGEGRGWSHFAWST
jgi:hypothetical protein